MSRPVKSPNYIRCWACPNDSRIHLCCYSLSVCKWTVPACSGPEPVVTAFSKLLFGTRRATGKPLHLHLTPNLARTCIVCQNEWRENISQVHADEVDQRVWTWQNASMCGPGSEKAQEATLQLFEVLDQFSGREFEELKIIAEAICGDPVPLVGFVRSFPLQLRREGAADFAGSDILTLDLPLSDLGQTQILSDAMERTSGIVQPPASRELPVRLFVKIPILSTEGIIFGALCVLGSEPRTLSSSQLRGLEGVAYQAMTLLHAQTVAADAEFAARERQQMLQISVYEREHLKFAMAAANLAEWHYDPDLGIVGGDARMQEFFGLDRSEAPASVWIDAVAEEDRARVTEEFAAGLQGAPYDTQYRVVRGNTTRWLHARAKLTVDADGFTQMIGISEDVTREAELRIELARSVERLKLAQDASGAVTFDWHLAEDRVTWGTDRVFGRPSAELQFTKDFLAIAHEADRAALEEQITRSIRDKKPYDHEFRLHTPDGSIRWARTQGQPLLDSSGAVDSVVGVNVDITQRKLIEEATLQSEKVMAVGKLASTMSHEINNPLEAVTNLLYLVRGSPELSQTTRDFLELADRELARVTQLTAQTLQLHRAHPHPTPISAAALVRESLEVFRSRLNDSQIQVELQLREDVLFSAFEGDIRQVINNLIANAFDAMRTGGVLTLRARNEVNWKSGEPGVGITIADTGPGIDAQARGRIFEAFYTTKGVHGTGLGLWVAKRIVQKHAGHLTFRSCCLPPGGTAFHIWLPRLATLTAREGWA